MNQVQKQKRNLSWGFAIVALLAWGAATLPDAANAGEPCFEENGNGIGIADCFAIATAHPDPATPSPEATADAEPADLPNPGNPDGSNNPPAGNGSIPEVEIPAEGGGCTLQNLTATPAGGAPSRFLWLGILLLPGLLRRNPVETQRHGRA